MNQVSTFYFSTGKLDSPPVQQGVSLILFLIVTGSSAALAFLGILPLHSAWTASTIRRPEGEVNVLLGVQADDEGRDVHHLLADPDRKNRVRGQSERLNHLVLSFDSRLTALLTLSQRQSAHTNALVCFLSIL